MGSISPSAELAARIQRLINELQVGDPLRNWPVRVCKEDLNALPVQANYIYDWALRPDGTVLRMDREELNHPTEPETDPLVIYAVIAHGADYYPELQELLPDLPAGAQPCEHCDGTGYGPGDVSWRCSTCDGLGWMIPRQQH
jgi:hypothetical protein